MSHQIPEMDLGQLLRQLDDDDLRKRIRAIEILGDCGDEVCLTELRAKMSLMHDEYQSLIAAIGKLKKRLGVK
jgi:HEAT repeat protein